VEPWREELKEKPVRYWSRIEIEEIIKKKNIERTRFYEYSKKKYSQVIKRFYYAFANGKKYPKIQLRYNWLHFKEELETLYYERNAGDWEALLNKIKEYLPYDWNHKLFLILSDGWVYEGYIEEIISVLADIDGIIEDFYIVTPEYDKLAAYCGDGDCIVVLKRF